jgi:hypothetical protein
VKEIVVVSANGVNQNEVLAAAGWNAFVELYRDNSDTKAEYLACMPKIPGK